MKGCTQGRYHHLDALGHTLLSVAEAEDALKQLERYFPFFADDFSAWLAVPFRPALLKLTLLWHDLGKPATRSEADGEIHFYGHEITGTDMAAALAARMRLSTAESGLVTWLVRHHLRPVKLMMAHLTGRLTTRGLYRFGRLAGPDIWGLILHALADGMASQGPAVEEMGGLAGWRDFLQYLAEQTAAVRAISLPRIHLINGRDVMEAAGIRPSPLVGRLLERVEEEAALGNIETREAALGLVRRLAAENPDRAEMDPGYD